MDPPLHAQLRATRGGRTDLTTQPATARPTTSVEHARQRGRAITHALTRASDLEPAQAVLHQPVGGSRLRDRELVGKLVRSSGTSPTATWGRS